MYKRSAWMNSDTYILHNELNWVTFLSNQSQTLLKNQICYQADFTNCLAWPEIGCSEWIDRLMEGLSANNVLGVVEVEAVNTEALLMQNDSCIANNTDWVGSSVCV